MQLITKKFQKSEFNDIPIFEGLIFKDRFSGEEHTRHMNEFKNLEILLMKLVIKNLRTGTQPNQNTSSSSNFRFEDTQEAFKKTKKSVKISHAKTFVIEEVANS